MRQYRARTSFECTFPIDTVSNIVVVCASIASVFLAACNNGGRVNTHRLPPERYFRESPPFPALREVHLGMSLRELKAVRAGIWPAPYVGAKESIGGDTVHYHFAEGRARNLMDELMLQFTPSDSDAVLIAIDSWHRLPHADSGLALWRRRVADLSRRGAVECFRYRHSAEARAVILRAEGLAAGAALYAPAEYKDAEYGTIRYPAKLRTFLTSDIERIIPGVLARTTISCTS